MHINLTLAPLVSLLAGILILVMPRLLNFIVALYLIIIGLIGPIRRRSFSAMKRAAIQACLLRVDLACML